MAPRIDLERVFAILGSEDNELSWDNCWDTLKLLDPSYRHQLPTILKGLELEPSFARLYAMEALKKVGLPGDQITDIFTSLLRDRDYEVQLEALKWIHIHNGTNPNVREALWSLLKSIDCSPYLKFRAALILLIFRKNNSLGRVP